LIACGSSSPQRPPTTVATSNTNDGDVVCGDEVSPTGVTHRTCHKLLPGSAETGEKDMICTDETPTGTNLTKRVCRSQNQKDDDAKLARDIYLAPSSRVACNPDLQDCSGQHRH
jgi:hypothetical protein